MAFRLAPAILQEDLCRLNTIFVNPTKADEVSPYDNQSFGVWENPSDQGNGSYIFLAQNQLLRTIAAAEADIQTKFLREVGATGRSVTYAITPNSQELGTLSVMLPEMAHVKWFAERVFENPCYLREIYDLAYQGSRTSRPWVSFAAPPGATRRGGRQDPRGAINKAQLRTVYQQDNASVFAASSPEEDYVETYKLYGLLKNTTRFDAHIDGDTDVAWTISLQDRAANPPLRSKLACIGP
jgi:hypothetical protein